MAFFTLSVRCAPGRFLFPAFPPLSSPYSTTMLKYLTLESTLITLQKKMVLSSMVYPRLSKSLFTKSSNSLPEAVLSDWKFDWVGWSVPLILWLILHLVQQVTLELFHAVSGTINRLQLICLILRERRVDVIPIVGNVFRCGTRRKCIFQKTLLRDLRTCKSREHTNRFDVIRNGKGRGFQKPISGEGSGTVPSNTSLISCALRAGDEDDCMRLLILVNPCVRKGWVNHQKFFGRETQIVIIFICFHYHLHRFSLKQLTAMPQNTKVKKNLPMTYSSVLIRHGHHPKS